MQKVQSDRHKIAAEWLVWLQDPGVSDEKLAEWGNWIEASPLNKRAFDEAERLSRRTDALRGNLLDIELPTSMENSVDEYDGSVAVSEWLRQQGAGTPPPDSATGRTNTMRRFALAAGVGVVAIGLALMVSRDIKVPQQQELIQVYETNPSEHQEVLLTDGSNIAIGAKSTVSINFTRRHRAVFLEQGEVLFKVAKDPNRPFVVVTGSGTITAVGTAFNVRRDDNRVVVTVTEGIVEVERPVIEGSEEVSTVASMGHISGSSSAVLSQGHQGTLDSEGISIVDIADPLTATTWLGGRHQFRAEPLESVVNVVNRYSSQEIIIADRAVAEMPFTGSVFQNHIDQWLPGLEAAFPIEVNYIGENTVIITRKKSL